MSEDLGKIQKRGTGTIFVLRGRGGGKRKKGKKRPPPDCHPKKTKQFFIAGTSPKGGKARCRAPKGGEKRERRPEVGSFGSEEKNTQETSFETRGAGGGKRGKKSFYRKKRKKNTTPQTLATEFSRKEGGSIPSWPKGEREKKYPHPWQEKTNVGYFHQPDSTRENKKKSILGGRGGVRAGGKKKRKKTRGSSSNQGKKAAPPAGRSVHGGGGTLRIRRERKEKRLLPERKGGKKKCRTAGSGKMSVRVASRELR